MSGVPARVRQTVLDRDLHSCVRCGKYLAFQLYSLHHRRPRGSGGSKAPETNLPGNIVTLCGTATTPGGCHLWAEKHRTEAEAAGLIVLHGIALPEDVPVLTHRGLLMLNNDGTWGVA